MIVKYFICNECNKIISDVGYCEWARKYDDTHIEDRPFGSVTIIIIERSDIIIKEEIFKPKDK